LRGKNHKHKQEETIESGNSFTIAHPFFHM